MSRKQLAAFLSIQAVVFCQYSLALARAGGGHSSRSSSSFSSGGPSSWGGSSHSSSSFFFFSPYSSSSADSSFWSILLIIAAVSVAVIFYIWIKRGEKSVPDSGDAVFRGEAPAIRIDSALAEEIARLKSRDPGFNEQVFQDKISTAFFEIENSWCRRDMGPARLFLSDAVYSRFQLQLDEYLRNHTFNRLDELSLDRAEIVSIRSDENYDTIDVWIAATAKDYTVDESGKTVSGSNALKTWDEKWSFMRSVKAVTRIGEGVKSVQCPNCGSPLAINAAGECEYCHSKVNKYDFDWVLSEIEQLNLG